MKPLFDHIVAYIICAVAAIFPSHVCRAQINTEQVMRIGENSMYFEDYILAIQYFNQAIQAKPYLPKPYYMRGLAKFYLEDYAGAEEDASKALEINPFIVDAHRLRGAARHSMGRFGEAVDDYDCALTEYPDDENIVLNKCRALLGLKEYALADSVFGTLIKSHPSLDGAYIGRAGARLMMNDTITALKLIDKGLELNPNDPDAYLMRYDIALNTPGEKPQALEALDKVVQLQPKNSGLYIARANLRYDTNDYFGAMADYSYALQLDPGNDIALFNRAMLRTEVLDYDNALSDFNEIIASDPDNDLALFNRARIHAEKGDFDLAIADISHFIDLYPQLSSAYFIRSQWLLEKGDRQRAKADYDKGRDLANYQRPITHYTRKKSALEKKYDSRQKAREDSTLVAEELTPEEFERRLNNVIQVDNDSQLSSKYEDSSIRGRIQNHNFNVDIEPMMQLSFYVTPSELQRKTYYIKDVDDINATHILRYPISVAIQPPTLTSEQVKRHFESIDYFTSYLTSHTPRPVDYIGRAMDFITLKNFQNAILDLNRAIDLNPDYAVAYLLRAQARAFDNVDVIPRNVTLKMVLDDLDKAVELAPRNAVAWYNKGNILFEAEDFTSAILAYSKAIDLQPDMGEAFFNRGYANLKLGNSADGKADLSKAGELGIVPAYNLIKRITRN